MAAADLFRAFGDEALPFVDFGGASRPANSLLAALLAKAASNDKRFVIGAVGAALGALRDSVSPVLLVVRLLPYSIHKNPKVRLGRAAAALLHSRLLPCSIHMNPKVPLVVQLLRCTIHMNPKCCRLCDCCFTPFTWIPR